MASQVCMTSPTVRITDPSGSLPPTRVVFDDNGFTVYSEGSGGDARAFKYVLAGGHFQLQLLKSMPEGNAQSLDAEGYILPVKM